MPVLVTLTGKQAYRKVQQTKRNPARVKSKKHWTGLDPTKAKTNLYLDKQLVAVGAGAKRSTVAEGRKQAPKHLQNSIIQVYF